MALVALAVRAERVDMSKIVTGDASSAAKNTEQIAQTVERLASAGGGTLYFPAGAYNVGPIELKSNITLELEAGALLKFSDDFDLYTPYVEVRHEGVMMRSFHPLIYAVDAENITIKGEGTIDGSGKTWWDEFFKVMVDLRDNGKRNINKYQPMFEQTNDMATLYAETNEDWHSTLDRRFFRPPFIQTLRCKNLKIQGITIKNSPFWTVNPQYCEGVNIDGITINNPASPNTDGVNPESCKNVHISNCNISVGDDCITIKSGRDLQARNIGVPCENITVTNCTLQSGHGGIVIGSEMSGGVKKLTISNCIFDGTDRGVRIKSTRGRGGVVEDIRISNIVMNNISQEALVFNLKYSNMKEEAKSDRTPVFRNIFVSGVSVRGVKTPIKVVGLEEAPITDIVMRDIFVQDAKLPCVFENCRDLKLDNVVVDGKEVTEESVKSSTAALGAPCFENNFSRPLGDVLNEVCKRFNIRLKYNVDTTGLRLDYADYRIRPYSVDETLTNVLSPFDFKQQKQNGNLYKVKPYEYPRRTAADGEKLLAYLSSFYNDRASFEKRKDSLRREVRSRLELDEAFAKCVKNPQVTFTKLRKFDGYTVQNFAIETYPGLFLCGSVYSPSTKGKHALIICPNGHFNQGRYREDQQQRMGTLARMGAVCVDYDLYGWGESEKQVGAEAHHKSDAHTIQTMNGLILLDYMLAHRTDIDTNRIGVNGGSGGGSQTVLLAALDDRFTASAPVVSLASHFDGGCPCESGKPIHLAGGGSCNAEFAATFAPKPMLVVSDGGDWTASVPTLEFPYLQKVYGFYDATNAVRNVHLPDERHDFGPNKRNAVYDFFADVFNLDRSKIDESKVTIEEESAMYGMTEN
jgi:polygalacturonase